MAIIDLTNRDTITTTISTSTSASTALSDENSESVVKPLPTSVKALTGFFVIVGLVLLGELPLLIFPSSTNLNDRCRCVEDWEMAQEQNPCGFSDHW